MKTPYSLNKSRRPKLLMFVGIFLFFLTGSLSLSTAIKTHAEFSQIEWDYFIVYFGWLLGVILLDRSIRRRLPNRDHYIFPITTALIGLGLLTIWRLSIELGIKQLVWFLVGSGISLIALSLRNVIWNLKRYKYIWMLFGLVLIALTFFIGVNPTGAGPRLWLKVFGLYIQPSEPLKLLMVIYLAGFFADQIKPNTSLLGSILPTMVMIGFAGLLLVGQRDLGTASLFIILYTLMVTVTTNRKRFLWIAPLIITIAGVIGYFTLDIVRIRVDIWLNPWLEASSSAYQLTQAQIAIAEGGLIGAGPGLGNPHFVPVAVSDFIFTALAEELGLFGSAALLLFLLILIMQGFNIAQSSKTAFGRYLAFGISAYLGIQTVMIVGGNLGLLPLTGVTLPFVSYGGSSLITNMLAVLLLLRISIETSPTPLPVNVRQPYRSIATGFILVFIFIMLWNGVLAFLRSDEIKAKNENPRWAVYDLYVPRGDVLTQDGHTLSYSIGSPGNYDRRITTVELSNTIGYTQGLYGQSGLELSLYPILRGYTANTQQTLWQHKLLYNQPPPGSDVKININLSLQNAADKLLGENRGAIILLNAKSGEIYVLASHPFFNANTLSDDWESLMSSQDAPLLNRVTQAVYPLGTLTNTLGLSAFWTKENNQDSVLPVSPSRIDLECYQAMKASNNELDVVKFGCESFSTNITNKLAPEELLEHLVKFGIFEAPQIALPVAEPSPQPDTNDEIKFTKAIMDTSVTPLQMALVAATITNDGKQPVPRLVNSYLDANNEWVSYLETTQEKTVIYAETASAIQKRLASSSQPIWFQSGHAITEDGGILTWYIGGTTEDWNATPLAIAIAIESSNAKIAQEIGSQLLNYLNID